MITHDFADGLSPMLVKELRQGMRSKALTISLFLLQGLLILNVIAGMGSSAQGDQSGTTAFFWSILALPLLVILPAAALGGVGTEIKANTLDLIFLTRLTARRIVLGKWLSVVTQSTLLSITVLPYIALRYYLGGINIAADLATAGLMLVASAMLSALTVALSSYPSKILRVLLGIGFFFSLQVLGTVGSFFLFGPGRIGSRWMGTTAPTVVAIVVLVPLFILLMLEVGTIRIAPAAENHSGVCRFLALLIVIVTGLAGLSSSAAEGWIIAGQILVTPFCVAALCEKPPTVPGVFRPLLRRGWFGGLLTRIFTPGWHTGFLYVLLVWAVLTIFWQRAGWLEVVGTNPYNPNALRRCLSLLGFGVSLLLPAIIAPAKSQKRFFYILGFHICCLIGFIVVLVLSEVGNRSALVSQAAFIPPVAVAGPALDDADPEPMLIWMGGLAVVSLLIYGIKSRAIWRSAGELRAAARQQMKPSMDHGA